MIDLPKNTQLPTITVPLNWARRVYGLEGAVTLATLSYLQAQQMQSPFPFKVEKLLEAYPKDNGDLFSKSREGTVLLSNGLYAACTAKHDEFGQDQRELVLVIQQLFTKQAFIECMNDKFFPPTVGPASSDIAEVDGRCLGGVETLTLPIGVGFYAYFKVAPDKAQEWLELTADTIIKEVIKLCGGASDTEPHSPTTVPPSTLSDSPLHQRGRRLSINPEEEEHCQNLPALPHLRLTGNGQLTGKGKGRQEEGQSVEDVFGPMRLLEKRTDNGSKPVTEGTDVFDLVMPLKRKTEDEPDPCLPPAKRPGRLADSRAQMSAQPIAVAGPSTVDQGGHNSGASAKNTGNGSEVQQQDTIMVPAATKLPRRSLLPIPVKTTGTSFAAMASNNGSHSMQAVDPDVAGPQNSYSGSGRDLGGRIERGRGGARGGRGGRRTIRGRGRGRGKK